MEALAGAKVVSSTVLRELDLGSDSEDSIDWDQMIVDEVTDTTLVKGPSKGKKNSGGR